MSRIEHPVLLFDGYCGLCNKAVDFTIRHDRDEFFYFTPLQSKTGQEILSKFGYPADYLDSVLLFDGEKLHSHSTALLHVVRQLPGPFPILYALIIIPKKLRDWIYGLIATNRYRWFGKTEACRIPTPEERSRFL